MTVKRQDSVELRALETQLRAQLGSEREAQATFLVLLGEFEARRGHEEQGFATLWDYCRRVLKLSNGETFLRTNAAAVVRRFPNAAARIADGRICMTALVQLRKVLTEENVERLLDRANDKSKEEIEQILVEIQPRDVSESTIIQRVPDPLPALTLDSVTSTPPGPPNVVEPPATPERPLPSPPVPAREESAVRMDPVGPGRFRIHMLVEQEFVDALRKATAALGHAVPDGDKREVLLRGLKMLLAREEKRSDPTKVRARKSKPQDPEKRRANAALERQVRARDGEGCTYPTADGPCGSTHRLQLDHIKPVARGGKTELRNLRRVCEKHNQMLARREFGAAHVEQKIRESRKDHVPKR